MPSHRGLTLQRFLSAIDPELMERYFTEKLPEGANLPERFVMSPQAVEVFMKDKRNEEMKALVLEDFCKINDICEKAKNHIVRAYNKYNITWKNKDTPENMAMKLFLDHKEAFDFAFTWFCYYHASSNLSSHIIRGNLKLTKSKLSSFQKDIKEWFDELAKGDECIIRNYDEEDTAVFLVNHGSYVKTVAYWKDDKIEFTSFQPANEDILLYEKMDGILRIKATLLKDREQYIRSFSKHIMGDESLADSADRDKTYALDPIQDGSFNWSGNEYISKILLTEIKLQLSDSDKTVVVISSGDVIKSLKENFKDIKISTGKLIHARFRFILNVDGKKTKVSVEVTPPAKTNLAQKRHSDIISDYLKEQRVKLV